LKGEGGGAWTAEVHGQLYPDNLNAGLVRFLVEEIRPRSFLEFGSGLGHLASAVAARLPLEPSYCIEPEVEVVLPADRQLHLLNVDIFRNPAPSVLNQKFDLVLSIEVAEHVERERHEELFDFLVARAGRFVVFSGARPGQGGHGHVAERPETEWQGEFESRGLIFDQALTLRARNYCDKKNINHRRNILVFRVPETWRDLEALERRAEPHLRDLLSRVLASSGPLVGNLFYVDLRTAVGGMPEESLKIKRLNLMRAAERAEQVLEIGFNAGHSALLMLLANPRLRITALDLFDSPYTETCARYLSDVFPGRLKMVRGDSRTALDLLQSGTFDLVHYDGGKDATIASDLDKTRRLVVDDHLLVIDDTHNVALRDIVQERIAAGQLSDGAFRAANAAAKRKRWPHLRARFAPPHIDAADRILQRVGELYGDTDFPSIYIPAPGQPAPGHARARDLIACIRDVEDGALDGAFVEVGVAAGHSSVIAALAASKFIDRRFYLFDTFEGFGALPEETDFEGRSVRDYDLSKYRGDDCDIHVVRRRMLAAGVPEEKLFLVQGAAEDTVRRFDPGEIAILRLDADLYAPTRAALDAFYDKLQPGGWLVVDDYGHWQGCREAVDAFFAARGETFQAKASDYTCYVMQKLGGRLVAGALLL
jgi:predicted O-methyltransferase YrrM